MNFPTVRIVDALLGICRRLLSESRVRQIDRSVTNLGGYAMYGLILLLALLLVVVAIRGNNLGLFVLAIVVVPVGIVLQYVALKMLGSVDRLIASSRTELTSSGFLDVVALINVLTAALAPLAGLLAAISFAEIGPFLSGLFVMALCGYTAAIALNPAVVNVHIARSASIGQEAVGIITFGMKGLYRFTPIGFGVLVILATIATAVLLVQALTGHLSGHAAQTEATSVLLFTLTAVLLPFFGYVFFVLFYLVIDFYRSIFLIAQIVSLYRRQDQPPGPPPPQRPPTR